METLNIESVIESTPAAETESKPVKKKKKPAAKATVKKVPQIPGWNKKKVKPKAKPVAKAAKPKKLKQLKVDFTPKAPAKFVKNTEFKSMKLIRAMIDARFERGESILTAATKAGMSKSGWQGVEASGIAHVSVLWRVCNYLQMPVQDFF